MCVCERLLFIKMSHRGRLCTRASTRSCARARVTAPPSVSTVWSSLRGKGQTVCRREVSGCDEAQLLGEVRRRRAVAAVVAVTSRR